MRFLAPLALGLAAAATTNPVLFVHVGKTCGGSAVAYLRRAVNVTEVHLRPVKREEVERASHIIVSVRDPTERVVSAFEWHRPGGDRTYGRCFHRKRDVERYGNSCADDELYKCAATADAFADLVASRNTTDRCARVAKAFLAPDAGARLLGEPLHFARLSHINRGFAFYLGEDTLKGRRVWVVEASACERDSRAFLAGLSLHQGPHVPDGAPPGPPRAVLPPPGRHHGRARARVPHAPSPSEACGELRPRRAAARAGLGLRAARLSEARPEEWENSVVRARVRSKKSGHRGCPRPGALLVRAYSLDLEALEREVERSARRDAPGREAGRAVAPLVRRNQLPRLADLHAEAALVPALDDAADAGLVREGLLARVLRGPELLARFLDDARRVDGRRRALGDLLARAGRDGAHRRAVAAGGRRHLGHRDLRGRRVGGARAAR